MNNVCFPFLRSIESRPERWHPKHRKWKWVDNVKSRKNDNFIAILSSAFFFLPERKSNYHDLSSFFGVVLCPLFGVHLDSSRMRGKVWYKMDDPRLLERSFFFSFLWEESIGVLYTLTDGTSRAPWEFFLCFFWIARRHSKVDPSTLYDLCRKSISCDILCHRYEFSNRYPLPCSEIPYIPLSS